MFNELIGMTIQEAIDFLSIRKIHFRISVEDEKPMMLTCDFVPGRVNLEVVSGIVVSYTIG
jgi:hypothetical protein